MRAVARGTGLHVRCILSKIILNEQILVGTGLILIERFNHQRFVNIQGTAVTSYKTSDINGSLFRLIEYGIVFDLCYCMYGNFSSVLNVLHGQPKVCSDFYKILS